MVELLMAMVVIGLAATGIMGALMTSTNASSVHRNLANDETILKSALEQAKYELEGAPSSVSPVLPLFSDCGASGTTASSLLVNWNSSMTTNGLWPAIPGGIGSYSTWISGVECFTESSSTTGLDSSCLATQSTPSASIASTSSGCTADDSGIIAVTISVLDPSNLTTSMTTMVRNPNHSSTYTTSNF